MLVLMVLAGIVGLGFWLGPATAILTAIGLAILISLNK
jgi:hypothetical protein